jgi:hypothetical protein
VTGAETAAIVRVIVAAYPTTEVTDDTLELWANAFATTPTDRVQAAVTAWILDNRWPPTIADVRTVIRDQRADARRRADMQQVAEIGPDRIALDEGRSIAEAAYRAECAAQGREPNPELIRRMTRAIGTGR